MFIEHYRKMGEGQWLLQEYRGDRGEIALESVGVVLVVKDIYEAVDFKMREGIQDKFRRIILNIWSMPRGKNF